jgi:general secretion pathway protein A
MYAPFFGFSKEPFSIAPDPRFLYMSERHREALAHLLYGLSAGGGFVVLTGEIGAGKTTVCRGFLEQVPLHCRVAYIFNPKLSVQELLRTVCDEFGLVLPAAGVDAPTSVKTHVDALNDFLLREHAQGRQAVLVIDEAQSLNAKLLEQLRLLTNLETAERKLLQIILIGQPELRDLLARPELKQLAQRVIARYHLDALSEAETPLYVRHRVAVAAAHATLPFDHAALARLHALSGGVPRRINLIADRALLGAYGQGQHQVTRPMVERAAQEVFGPEAVAPQPARRRLGAPAAWFWGACAGAAMAVLSMLWLGPARMAIPGATPPLAAGAQDVPVTPPAAEAAGGAASASLAAVATPQAAAAGVVQAAAEVLDTLPAPAAGTASNAPQATAADAQGAELVDVQAVLAAAHRQPGMAWRELALRWHVAVGEGDPCAAVLLAQLACFRSPSAGLPGVRMMSRPGVLVLRDAAGRPLYALLVALDDSHATLQVGARRFRWTLETLAAAWRGEFLTLWRTPAGWKEGLDPMNNASLRTWVEARLPAASLAGASGGSAASVSDRVQVYQRAQGLPADGLLGPMTWMRLQRQAGVAEPGLPPL